MLIDKRSEQAIAEHGYLDGIKTAQLAGILLLINDRDGSVIDMTEDVARLFGEPRQALIGKSLEVLLQPPQQNLYEPQHASIFDTGKPISLIQWVELSDGWHKFILTKILLSQHYILTIGHELTAIDPVGKWLRDTDLDSRRLYLGDEYGDGYLEASELTVLAKLLRGMSYREVAAALNISVSTIKYRLEKVKTTLAAGDMAELWDKIIAAGLVHVLALEADSLPQVYRAWFDTAPNR